MQNNTNAQVPSGSPNKASPSPQLAATGQAQPGAATAGTAQTNQGASNSTKEKAASAKAYIESKYAKAKYEERERKEAWDKLTRQMDQMKLSEQEKDLIKQEILHKESENYRLQRTKISVRDFIPRKIIGRGAFGEVRVCRNRKTNEIVAIKKMKKQEMIYKNQIAHVRAERDILALANNPWTVELKCSFQDEKFLYLVMEYLQGGDLMTLLMEKDILSEEMSRFYIAETILAIESVHNLNYIHRDLKPDNLIIGKDGHIKLSDFGLCKHVEIQAKSQNTNDQMRSDLANINKEVSNRNPALSKGQINKRSEYIRNRKLAFSTVGTPDYIAPEVFGQKGYSESVDWWSAGAILFEMLVGYPPFFSDEPSITCQKILQWRKTLTIPDEAKLSNDAHDILKKLLCDAENRLGAGGVHEIKAHPFFKGLDWKNIRNQKASFLPEIKDEEDCSRFDDFEEEEPFYPQEENSDARGSAAKKKKKRQEINFPGYTYKKEVEDQKTKLVQALKGLLNNEDIENEGDGDTSPPEQEQRIPKQQVRTTAPQQSHQTLQASQQSNQNRQQTIEQKNKQIAIKNTNVGQNQQQYYNNSQTGQGQGASQGMNQGQQVKQNIQSTNGLNTSQLKVQKLTSASKKSDDTKGRSSAMNQILQTNGQLATGAGSRQIQDQQQQPMKKGLTRNNQNLGGGGTAGQLLQGGPPKQMNFTTYESGFGANMNGPNAGQPSVSSLGKSSRLVQNEFGTGPATAAGGGTTTPGQSTRNGQNLVTNSTNSLIKSHQQMTGVGNVGKNIYSNIQQNSSLGIKSSGNPALTQQKFLSKSPNQQNRLLANTNYGKFKAIPTNQNQISGAGMGSMNSAYARGQGANGQYLPKLGGGTTGMTGSQQQLAQYQHQNTAPQNSNLTQSQLHYQQQHLLQQSSGSQLSSHGNMPTNPHSSQAAYQQMTKDQQIALMQQIQRQKQPQPGGHVSSVQNLKQPQNIPTGPSSQAINFRQNLNMSLQQLQSQSKGSGYRNSSAGKK